jgi:hypothetical protein
MTAPRDRFADLDKLADAVIGAMEDGGESFFGLDGKRPFGFSDVDGSVLEITGAEPEGMKDGYPAYSDDQRDYAADLWGDVLTHIKDRWREMRAGSR